jgi:hypothetical protein
MTTRHVPDSGRGAADEPATKRVRFAPPDDYDRSSAPRTPSPSPAPTRPRRGPASVGLRDLPESALLMLFDLTSSPVSEEPWSRKRALGFIFRASGAPTPKPEYAALVEPGSAHFDRRFGSHALAAVSPGFADTFRRTCISTVLANPVSLAGNEEAVHVPGGLVAAAFRRFPNADALVFNNHSRTAECNMDLARVMGGAVVETVARLVLRRITFGVGDVDEIHRAFPNLAELVLLKCVVSDTDIALLSWRLGPTLRKMRLLGTKTGLNGNHITDAGAVGVREMVELQVLCLDRQSALTSLTFVQLALLSKLRSLNLDYTRFNDDDAGALTGLSLLQNLSVASCSNLTHRMLALLPANLETLNVSQTTVLSSVSPKDAFAVSPPVASQRLVTLQADQMELMTNWNCLVGASSLKQVYMRKCHVTAVGAKEAFESWPGLRRLDISGCHQFGGGGANHQPAQVIVLQFENQYGDAAIEALSYVSMHVKELRVDNTDISTAQWVAIAAKVMASPSSGKQMTLLTLTKPHALFREWSAVLLAEAVPALLGRAFRRAVLRLKEPVAHRD